MKKMIIYSVVLFSAMLWLVPSVSAQEPIKWELAKGKEVIAEAGEFEVHVGDTVVVSKNQRYYLTGDTIRKWVYNVCAVVKKVGGARFPDGILLENINSWITPEALILVGPVDGPQPQPEVVNTPMVVAPVAPATPVIIEEPKPEPIVEPKPEPVAEPVAENEPEVVEAPVALAEPEEVYVAAEPVHTNVANAHCAHRLSIGVRGGVTSLLQDAGEAKCQLGWDALLDLQYAYYGITQQQHKVGLLLGVSAGYTRAGMKLDALNDQFAVTTSDGEIQYTVSAENIVEKHGLVTVEVPVMFSLVTQGGFFMNIGPKVQIPVYSHYSMCFENPQVDAYFTRERVFVQNELITGRVDQNEAKGKFDVAKYNLLAGLELGYEWKLKSGDALALGAFADYNMYTFYKSGAEAEHVINIVPPSDQAQPAQIEYHSLRDVFGKNRLYLNCGLKLTYHFLVGKPTLK